MARLKLLALKFHIWMASVTIPNRVSRGKLGPAHDGEEQTNYPTKKKGHPGGAGIPSSLLKMQAI
jgi:hypothetical protein